MSPPADVQVMFAFVRFIADPHCAADSDSARRLCTGSVCALSSFLAAPTLELGSRGGSGSGAEPCTAAGEMPSGNLGIRSQGLMGAVQLLIVTVSDAGCSPPSC